MAKFRVPMGKLSRFLEGQQMIVEAPDDATDEQIAQLAIQQFMRERQGAIRPEDPSTLLGGRGTIPGGAPLPPEERRKPTLEALLAPKTPTEAGLFTLALLPGGKAAPTLLRPLPRIATGAAVGAAGRALEGQDPLMGAVEGAGVTALGEAGAAVIGRLMPALLARKIRRDENPRTIADFLRREVGIPVTPEQMTPRGIQELLQSSNISSIVRERFLSQQQTIAQVGQGQVLRVPALSDFLDMRGQKIATVDYPVGQALEIFSKIGPEAFTIEGKPVLTRAGRSFREVRQAAADEIGKGLAVINPGLKQMFDQARHDLAVGMSIQRAFDNVLGSNPSRVFLPKGGVDLGPIQLEFQRLGHDWGITASKADLERFQAAMTRGAKTTESDVMGRLSFRLGGAPSRDPFGAVGGIAMPSFAGRPVSSVAGFARPLTEVGTRPLRRGLVPGGE